MSCKEITITTKEGNLLNILVVRQILCRNQRKGFLVVNQTFIKRVIVQYGIGISAEGTTLKEAVRNFQLKWSSSCNNTRSNT